MDQPRIGVAGVGGLGRHHARVVRDLSGTEAAGVFDVDAARSAAVGRELGVTAHATLEALLEASDAVVVAVPTRAHESVAVAAADAGVHVFVEKPLAPDLKAGKRIEAAAEAAGVVLQVGHVERFNAAVRAARPYMEQPLFVESHRLAPFSPRSLDVAVVLDLMIHDVDLVASLVGQPVVSIAGAGVPVLSRYADIANARLQFHGGAVANLTASRISTRKVRKLRVWQRSGYISLDLAAGQGEFYRLRDADGGLGGPRLPPGAPALDGLASVVERIPILGDGIEPLVAELRSFRNAVQGLAPPPVTGQDGRRALDMALAIEEQIDAIEKQIEENVADTRSPTS